MNILFLTHTDIHSDSRILKEMTCVARGFNDSKTIGIGVKLDEEKHKDKSDNNFEIYSINLKSRQWKILPTIVRHTFSLIELTVKMIFLSLKKRPQVVHCNDTLVLPLGVMIKLLTNSRLIYDAHELESNRNGLTKLLGKMTLLVEKTLWGFVDELIVVSPSISKWYNENVGEKSTEVILNSPILHGNDKQVDKTYFRKKFGIPNDSKIFLYIGILGFGRGINLIADIFQRDDINSHVVFLGYGELKDELISLSNSHSNIHFHDAVPHGEVVPIAKSADVGLCLIQNVSLSDYYCLPNKLFEYTFAQIPVLASNFPDISAIVEEYNLGKCCDLDSESIYKAIREFECMSELPKIDANDLYELSWAAQEEKLLRIYKETLKSINEEKK